MNNKINEKKADKTNSQARKSNRVEFADEINMNMDKTNSKNSNKNSNSNNANSNNNCR